MWDRFVFVIQNLKVIILAGLVTWMLIVATLDLVGLINIEADCPSCAKVFDLIPKAFGAEPNTRAAAPMTVRVTLLP